MADQIVSTTDQTSGESLNADALAIRAFAFLFGMPLALLVFSLPLLIAADNWREHRPWQYVAGVAALWTVAALVILQSRRERLPGMRKWFGRLRSVDVLIAVAFLVVGIAVMYYFSQWTGWPREWHLPQTTAEKILWVTLCLSVGVCEEIIYRGYCLTRLTAAFKSPMWAWLVQAALYGLLHFAFGPTWIGFTTAVGLLMGGVVLWRKSLWPAIIVHVLADLAVLFGGA